MKKYVLVVLAVLGLVASANAAYYIAGDFNGWNAAGNLMTDNLDGTYSVSLSGISAGSHQFKVTIGDWTTSYPGPNSWLYADASGNTTVTFNTNTVSDGWSPGQYRIGLSTAPTSWAVPGDFNGWNNTADVMTDMGGGIYMLTKTLAAGTYQFKSVVSGTWDAITHQGRVAWGDNYWVTTTDTQVVNIYVDAINGVAKTEIVPEPATLSLLGLGALAMLRRKK